MALEDQGISINVEKLKKKLQERYPEYNFDVPAPPDTTCKARAFCKANRIMYTDTEGNLFCGQRYKQVDEDNPYKWEWMTCHALVKQADQGGNQDEIPF